MKYIYCLLTIVLFCCTSKSGGEPVADVKPKLVMGKTFPFSEADKIEIVSYPVRSYWDTIREGKKTYLGSLVVNKKLVDSSGFKERIFLDDKLKRDLFNSLFVEKTSDCSVASCFNPRHAILFHNKKNEIIAYIEICFECGYDRGSKGLKYNELCYEGLAPIGKIFKEAGIKYFGE